VSTSVVKWSEGLSNRVSIMIRRNIDRMRKLEYLPHFFVFFLFYLCHCINGLCFVCFYLIL